MILTVFGGSSPKPDSLEYQESYKLGQLAAQHGWTVATGGYIGVMEAASRGAADAGGHVIGVTCEDLSWLRPIGANAWVKEERKFPSLRERLWHLVEICDAAIAMPGGVGTLAEISVMWNGLIIHSIPSKPLVVVGSAWHEVMDMLLDEQHMYIRDEDSSWLSYASDGLAGFEKIVQQLNGKNPSH